MAPRQRCRAGTVQDIEVFYCRWAHWLLPADVQLLELVKCGFFQFGVGGAKKKIPKLNSEGIGSNFSVFIWKWNFRYLEKVAHL